MIGPRIGLRVGPKVGLAVGVSADELGTGGLAGVTRDATSGIYCPASAAEWSALMTAAGLATGNPGFLWLMQDASGNMTDQIGSVPLAPANAPSYQQTVAGWSRLAGMTTDGVNQVWSSTSALLPDLSATSALLLAYVGFPVAPGAVRGVLGTGLATSVDVRHTGVSPRILSGANTGNGAATIGSPVRPWVARNNFTGSTTTLLTDQEKVVAAYGTPAGKQVRIGATAAIAAGAQYLYAAMFIGAAAELSDAQVKTLLSTLGWSIPWS